MKLFWIWPSIWPYEASIWSVPLFHHQGELNLMVMGVVSGMRVLIWAARSKPETGVTGLTSLDPWWLPGIGAAWLSSSLDIASTNPLTWVISHLLAEMRQPASRFRLNWGINEEQIWSGWDMMRIQWLLLMEISWDIQLTIWSLGVFEVGYTSQRTIKRREHREIYGSPSLRFQAKPPGTYTITIKFTADMIRYSLGNLT